ncbi:hypothetical protein VaNZ11_004167 [Volvox africanus]|uniref:DNA helicase n=1 Tax=Volvox africanus TaxID=51714 RepID=A0ABQ5RXH7_9CHLO|nr:hypothetical protein VaNZ11_004167 [Volvox africanus]
MPRVVGLFGGCILLHFLDALLPPPANKRLSRSLLVPPLSRPTPPAPLQKLPWNPPPGRQQLRCRLGPTLLQTSSKVFFAAVRAITAAAAAGGNQSIFADARGSLLHSTTAACRSPCHRAMIFRPTPRGPPPPLPGWMLDAPPAPGPMKPPLFPSALMRRVLVSWTPSGKQMGVSAISNSAGDAADVATAASELQYRPITLPPRPAAPPPPPPQQQQQAPLHSVLMTALPNPSPPAPLSPSPGQPPPPVVSPPLPPSSPARFSVFSLPGMDLKGPPGYQASGTELLAAVAAATPDQHAVWAAVWELMPLLLHVTADGPLRGFSVDVETTGFNWRAERVMELAAVDLTTGDTFSSLVNPNGAGCLVKLDPRVVAVTGITSEMLRPAPSEPWVTLAFLCWLYQRCRAGGGVRPALVGHNLRTFDCHFLGRMLARQGCLVPYSWCSTDTLSLTRKWRLWPGGGNLKLQSLREMYGIPQREEHRALPDALLTVDILAAMIRHRVTGSPGPYPPSSSAPREVVQQALNDGTLTWFEGPEALAGHGVGGAASLAAAANSLPRGRRLGPRDTSAPVRGDVQQLFPWNKLRELLVHLGAGTAAAAEAAATPYGSTGGQNASATGASEMYTRTSPTDGGSGVSGGAGESAASGDGVGDVVTRRQHNKGRWTMADVLLSKTATAKMRASMIVPCFHGPDFNSAPQRWCVRHPSNDSYSLPEAGEELPEDVPPAPVRGPLDMALEAPQYHVDDTSLLPKRSQAVNPAQANSGSTARPLVPAPLLKPPMPSITPAAAAGAVVTPTKAGIGAREEEDGEPFSGGSLPPLPYSSGGGIPEGAHEPASGSTSTAVPWISLRREVYGESQPAQLSQDTRGCSGGDDNDAIIVEGHRGVTFAAATGVSLAAVTTQMQEAVAGGRGDGTVAAAAVEMAETVAPEAAALMTISTPTSVAAVVRGRRSRLKPPAQSATPRPPPPPPPPLPSPSSSLLLSPSPAVLPGKPSTSPVAEAANLTSGSDVAAVTAQPPTASRRAAVKRTKPSAAADGAAASGDIVHGWEALGAPFSHEPFRTDLWLGLLPRRPPLLEKLEAAAAAGRLPTPHALLLAVPRAIVQHHTAISVTELTAALAVKDAMRSRLGSWREVRDELRETPGMPVALRAEFGNIKIMKLMPRGWSMTAELKLLPGQLLPGDSEAEGSGQGGMSGGTGSRKQQQQQQQQVLANLQVEATWSDFANPRADKAMRQRREAYLAGGSEWVVRGILRPKPAGGARVELANPDVLPAASFQRSWDLVTATYRAATPLQPGEVAAAAGALLDAIGNRKIVLSDPLPPAARRELNDLLTTGGHCSIMEHRLSSHGLTEAGSGAGCINSSANSINLSSLNKGSSSGVDIRPNVKSTSGSPPLRTSWSSSSSSWPPVSTDLPHISVPSLVESYEILHRPRLEHLQPCRVIAVSSADLAAPQHPVSTTEAVEAATAANESPLWRAPRAREGGSDPRDNVTGGEAATSPIPQTAFQVAGRVVAFHELFFSQLQMQQLRRSVRGPNWAPVSADALMEEAVASLGFRLTGAQQRAVSEVLADMRPDRTSTMYRLLQGDVGSGKTAVAFLAMLAAASAGLQALLVVPTTVLAQQHHRSLLDLMRRVPLSVRRRWGLEGEPLLLTGEAKAREKRDASQGLEGGSIRLAVGTHGLLNVTAFRSLGLLVLDESHKFGVAQMERLSHLIESRPPHLLNMSATPIPRTLAAAMYGHMDVSRLDEMPPGRTPVITKLVQDDTDIPYQDTDAVGEMEAMWEEVLREVTTGDTPGRAFVVYPLREASTAAAAAEELKNAADQAAVLAARFEPQGVSTRLLHGKMKAEEKAAALEEFRSGKVRVLVSTTVVEVGVDVPEATVMVVEHAERFGLAQLHQLRGRVGRGGRGGRCFLCVPFGDRASRERLGIMETTSDGFLVAEWDLEQRGVGHLFGSGTRQHGRIDVSGVTAAVIEESGVPAAGMELVEAARRAAVVVAREWEMDAKRRRPTIQVEEDREEASWCKVTLAAMAVFRSRDVTAAEALMV